MDKFLHDFHEIATTKQEKIAVRKKLRDLLVEKLKHDKEAVRMEIKLLDEEKRELLEELEELQKIGKDGIEHELNDLLDDEEEE